MTDIQNRCRLVLVAPETLEPQELASQLQDALSGGDVASVIVPQRAIEEGLFQDLCAAAVPVIQAAGAAALIDGDSRIAGRVRADGLFIAGGFDDLAAAVEKHTPAMIVGGGNARDRHQALSMGDLEPDFLFFGRPDGDIKPEPHRKNVDLAEWWASMVDIPCILMGGNSIEHGEEMAATGAEFIAFGKAVFAADTPAGSQVTLINRMLDEKAPRFDD
ncbi:thiamine phosphate synthase [Pseudohoeflea coraliihabitans]|uniref:Thiamine phosphate synthase n=1 Tax=Pseudohoeflea coraliihabitans TaxID=2860393 RepID=A0ABS6WPH6_9HYPH|nr:thiamine phosphate synthase [Pseudohoeflea sp. DP4N28-3]MBW3097867.1 thiamine phosphate synthase [Pseudohoeflea sp. DP4N28-3]